MSENERQRLIEEKLGRKEAEMMKDLALIRRTVNDILIEGKGYSRSDIEFDREFGIELDGKKYQTSVDYIIRIDNRRLMAVKCSPGSLESRERHLIAFGRVVDSYQIPLVVLTEGSYARILDTSSGKLIAEGLENIPDKQQALDMMNTVEFKPYPPDRIDREKRVLLAFDAISCTQEMLE